MGSNVAHPSHYNTGKIEVIEFIEDNKLNFHLGNAVKYVSRAGKKDPNKHIEDLEKAVWYIEREISLLRGEEIRPNDMRPKTDSLTTIQADYLKEHFKKRSEEAEKNILKDIYLNPEKYADAEPLKVPRLAKLNVNNPSGLKESHVEQLEMELESWRHEDYAKAINNSFYKDVKYEK